MFYIGQDVICVDARQSDGALVRNERYRVSGVSPRFLNVEGFAGPLAGWHKFRFRPAPSIEGLRALLKPQPVMEPAQLGD